MTHDDKLRLKAKLLGTCDSVQAALEFLDFDVELAVAEDGLLDVGCEQCKDCGWWHECGELDNERDGELGYCDSCQPKSDDD